ncbi:hypothetical protein GKR48_12250 [Providencia sp. wls1943]|uniref:hypothetical protein n=1 Tax=unclassified Providencia TaxID=2633465 RepID=UPI0012B546C1|nr:MULTISPECIES: hypothetical protein [unclassified Providencia]MTB67585.1 hypothetical protein [Providencia sp. wls1943]
MAGKHLLTQQGNFIPDETKIRSNGNMWHKFTQTIAEAAQFEVYVDDKPIGKFQSNEKIGKKFLQTLIVPIALSRLIVEKLIADNNLVGT